MASKKTGNPVGRPTDFKPEYCEQLLEHMRQGGSFEAFGGVIRVAKQTLYNWTELFPEFMDAKKVGNNLSLKYYEDMGKLMSAGQLRRVKKETPMLDKEGKPMLDGKGNAIMEREYEYGTGAQSTWIFMMKNMHKWRDRVDMNVAGQPGEGGGDAPAIKFDFTGQSMEQMEKRMTELLLKANKVKK